MSARLKFARLKFARPATALVTLVALAMPVATVLAEGETSSWPAERRVLTPGERAGGAKILKSMPIVPPNRLSLPPPGADGVVTTHAPGPGVPILPSDIPAGTTTITKLPANADPGYEAFDLGHYNQALDLAKAADARGEPQAATLIGRLYQEGLGVPKNDVEAAKWYRRGAERGDINAMFAFGVMLNEGGAIKQDKAGAAQMFEGAASKGHVVASYDLALMFLTGEGKPENPRRGAALLEYAADAGLSQAAYDLGTLYATGKGVPANVFTSAKWFQKAAEAGFPDAQLDYGIYLMAGEGTEKNEPMGAEMFRRAAEKGNVVAQDRYALCKANGLGVAKNPIEATGWYLIAKAAGLDDPNLAKVAAALPKADRLKAERAAEQWRDRSQLQ